MVNAFYVRPVTYESLTGSLANRKYVLASTGDPVEPWYRIPGAYVHQNFLDTWGTCVDFHRTNSTAGETCGISLANFLGNHSQSFCNRFGKFVASLRTNVLRLIFPVTSYETLLYDSTMAELIALRAALVRMGLSGAAANFLTADQGLDSLAEFGILTDDEVTNQCKVVRRPGGTMANPEAGDPGQPA